MWHSTEIRQIIIYPVIASLLTVILTGLVSAITDGSIVSWMGGLTKRDIVVEAKSVARPVNTPAGGFHACPAGTAAVSCVTLLFHSGSTMCGSTIKEIDGLSGCQVNECSPQRGQFWRTDYACAGVR